MLEAFGLGVLGASSLLFAGLVACWLDVPARLVGVLAGFGAGALIAAISVDLVVEAEDVLERWQFALWMLIGVAASWSPTRWIDMQTVRVSGLNNRVPPASCGWRSPRTRWP